MTQVLSPAAFRDDVQRLILSLRALENEYAIAHDAAFSSQVMEQASVASGPSNIPHALVDQHASLRAQLRSACELIRKVHLGRRQPPEFFGIEQQTNALRAALGRSERRHGPMFDPVRFPRSVYKDEVEAAVDAQGRRRAVGSETGDDAAARDANGLPPIEEEFRRGVR